eukprot:11869594-Karenia_brevis.AAC.1
MAPRYRIAVPGYRIPGSVLGRLGLSPPSVDARQDLVTAQRFYHLIKHSAQWYYFAGLRESHSFEELASRAKQLMAAARSMAAEAF